jgi:hypothetical protein
MSCALRRPLSMSSLTVLVLMASASLATAAELKLLAARAMDAALRDIVAGYEQASGNKVASWRQLAPSPNVCRRVRWPTWRSYLCR